jgi:holo-[acyl-carrier protein] synthase
MFTRCGVDIVKVKRIEEAIERRPETFMNRVFTPAEVAYCEKRKRKYEHLAARFAAKEAFYKALSPEGVQLRFRELEIRHRSNGGPEFFISPAERTRLGLTSDAKISVSLSHDTDYAVAVVLIG